MIGIDTNVLVRYHIKDNPEQYEKVISLFRQADQKNPIYINLVVVIEWFWVLTEIYEVSKTDVVKELEFILESREILLERSSDIRKSLQLFKKKNIDFEDCLIGILNSSKNCNTTFTFDKDASKLSPFTLLN